MPSHESRWVEGYRLPFLGRWLVANGGVTRDECHSFGIVNQRYAYDFVAVDDQGRAHDGDGKSAERFFAFGRDVVASKAGEVVEAHDSAKDADKVRPGRTPRWVGDLRGNFVVIRHGDDEYSFLAHLMRGSLKVSAGQHVRAGQELALCGNSGNTTQPHIHFHVQDIADFFSAVSIPLKIDGAFPKKGEYLVGA